MLLVRFVRHTLPVILHPLADVLLVDAGKPFVETGLTDALLVFVAQFAPLTFVILLHFTSGASMPAPMINIASAVKKERVVKRFQLMTPSTIEMSGPCTVFTDCPPPELVSNLRCCLSRCTGREGGERTGFLAENLNKKASYKHVEGRKNDTYFSQIYVI